MQNNLENTWLYALNLEFPFHSVAVQSNKFDSFLTKLDHIVQSRTIQPFWLIATRKEMFTCWVHEPWIYLGGHALPFAAPWAAWQPWITRVSIKTNGNELKVDTFCWAGPRQKTPLDHGYFYRTKIIDMKWSFGNREWKTYTYIFSWWARNINPCLGEECTGAQHKDDIHNGMYGVFYDVTYCLWRGHVITQATSRVRSCRPATSFLQMTTTLSRAT